MTERVDGIFFVVPTRVVVVCGGVVAKRTGGEEPDGERRQLALTKTYHSNIETLRRLKRFCMQEEISYSLSVGVTSSSPFFLQAKVMGGGAL